MTRLKKTSTVGKVMTRICECGGVQKPLVAIGMDLATVYSRKVRGRYAMEFWDRHADCLPDVLKAAHAAYRQKMKIVHSDKSGGSHEQAVLVNAAWRRVKYLFGKHGVVN